MVSSSQYDLGSFSTGLTLTTSLTTLVEGLCVYDHTYSKSMNQLGKVANPARGQLNRENEYFLVPVPA